MIVAVGSKNPTKIAPVKKIFSKHFKNVKVVGVNVSSDVADQPMSEEEIYEGAFTRAVKALKQTKGATYGVGIEAGVHKYSFGWIERSTVVIMDKKGNIGIGSTGGFVLPDKIMTQIKKGKNLQEIIDDLFGTKEIGKGIGMWGIFTKGVVTRAKGTEHGVAFALSRFLHKDLF